MIGSLPQNHPQRKSCIDAIDVLLSKPPEDVPPLLRAEIESKTLPVLQKYGAMYKRYRAAKSAEHSARLSAEKADLEHDRTLKAWRNSVEDADGRPLYTEIKLLLGKRVGQIIRLPYGEQLAFTAELPTLLADHPHLAGDPADLAAFLAARAILEDKNRTLEAALRTRVAARRALDEMSGSFDDRWRSTVQIIEGTSVDLAIRVLPVFRKSQKKKKKKKKEDETKGEKVEAKKGSAPEAEAEDEDEIEETEAEADEPEPKPEESTAEEDIEDDED